MKLAVYEPVSTPLPLVLAPACMQPSLEMVHAYGDFRLRGVLDIDESVLQTQTAQDLFRAAIDGQEFLITAERAARYIGTLINDAGLSAIGLEDGLPQAG